MRYVTAMLLLGCACQVNAQGGGMMGGMGGSFSGSYDSNGRQNPFEGNWPPSYRPEVHPDNRALAFITVDGVAEIRVVPEKIRIVMAVTSQAEDAADCQRQVEEQIQRVRAGWNELGVSDEDVVEDFIAVLPRYEWHVRERDGEDMRIQERVGYRMQTNLHLSVPDEASAMRAVHSCFKNGVTDIITFDYWSSKLDEEKQRVIKLALTAAQQKANTLLSVFEKKPTLINVEEHTGLFFPRSLYRTFENVLEEEIRYPRSWNDLPEIKAFRPRKTFFDRLKSQSDVRPKAMDMRPDIAVISTVRLYFQSPATKQPVSVSQARW